MILGVILVGLEHYFLTVRGRLGGWVGEEGEVIWNWLGGWVGDDSDCCFGVASMVISASSVRAHLFIRHLIANRAIKRMARPESVRAEDISARCLS